ncbi:unnamed protein product [Mycena citricolor]|uniref:Uncharacterized protein n=1 Tax=Mycena citricolor TaxID=2018698 RepID=A0AAD2K3P4_9AGAR|nr:unnamed protein product [Mycena citricolor]
MQETLNDSLPPVHRDPDRWGPASFPYTLTPGTPTLAPGLTAFPSSPTPPTSLTPPPQSVSPSGSELVGTVMLDQIANHWKLDAEDKDRLRFFVRIGSLGPGLSLPALATGLYSLAAELGIAAAARRLQEKEQRDYHAVMRDLEIRLADTFTLTTPQKENVRSVIASHIFEARRTSFSTLHLDVMAHLQVHQQRLDLDNIFGIPTRVKCLSQFVKRQCSGLRNSFRTDLVASINAKTFCNLATFVNKSARKYKGIELTTDTSDPYIIQVALLRRFVFDHPTLSKSPKESEEDEDQDPEEIEERPKKRGRTTKGADFWGQVEEWFKAEISKRGSSFTTPAWKEYIDQILKDDRDTFKGLISGAAVRINIPRRADQSGRNRDLGEGLTPFTAQSEMDEATFFSMLENVGGIHVKVLWDSLQSSSLLSSMLKPPLFNAQGFPLQLQEHRQNISTFNTQVATDQVSQVLSCVQRAPGIGVSMKEAGLEDGPGAGSEAGSESEKRNVSRKRSVMW